MQLIAAIFLLQIFKLPGVSGFYNYVEWNSNLYFLSDKLLTQPAAEIDCVARGGHLASVNSASQNLALKQFLSPHFVGDAPILFGLIYVGGSSSYSNADGQTQTYFNWMLQTASSTKPCVLMGSFTGTWYPSKCQPTAYHYVCDIISPPQGYAALASGFYFASFAALNSTDAERDCVRRGGHLSSILSAGESGAIASWTQSTFTWFEEEILFGTSFSNKLDGYKNLDNQVSDYRNWNSIENEPGNVAQLCTVLAFSSGRSGRWHDVYCSWLSPYLCKIAVKTVIQSTSTVNSVIQVDNQACLYVTSNVGTHLEVVTIFPFRTLTMLVGLAGRARCARLYAAVPFRNVNGLSGNLDDACSLKETQSATTQSCEFACRCPRWPCSGVKVAYHGYDGQICTIQVV